jgi:hypothetical protein
MGKIGEIGEIQLASSFQPEEKRRRKIGLGSALLLCHNFLIRVLRRNIAQSNCYDDISKVIFY